MRAVNCWLRRGFLGAALSHLQQARIDGLRFRLLVDFSRAAAFENHAGDAGDVVPDGEVGDGGLAWQREIVDALLNCGAVVSEDLPHSHACHAVIDANFQHHFVQ